MIKLNNKGQISLGDSPALIRTLIIVAITLTVAGLILVGFRTEQVSFVSTQVVNETHGVTNANATFHNATAFTTIVLDVNVEQGLTGTSVVTNATAGNYSVVPASNYSITSSAGQATFRLLSREFNNTVLNITYNYLADPDDHFSNITNDSLGGIQTFGGFQALISLVIVAVVILGLILFIGGRQS